MPRYLAIAVAVLAGLWVLVAGGNRLLRDCSFDERAWAQRAHFESVEHDIELLVHCGTLAGRSQADVVELLGAPDHGERTATWHYEVGVPEALSDYPPLTVTFDDQRLVDDVRVDGHTEPGPLDWP